MDHRALPQGITFPEFIPKCFALILRKLKVSVRRARTI
jgi:hypothetical protein